MCKSDNVSTLFWCVDERFHVDDKQYAVVRCNGCGLVRLSPRPSDRLLPKYYPDSFYSPRFIGDTAGLLKRFVRTRRATAVVNEKLMIVHRYATPPGLLVDIGCAAGEYLVGARKAGWNVCGVEYSPETAQRVGKELGMDIRSGSILDVKLPTNIKVCSFWASMEHIGDPLRALEKISEVLVDEGIVIVLVPNFGSWESRLSDGRWPHLDVPRHLYHFEKESLAKLGRAAGLEVVSVRAPDTRLAASHWSTVFLPTTVSKKRIVRYTLSPITWFLTRIAGMADRNHTLVAVFRKSQSRPEIDFPRRPVDSG